MGPACSKNTGDDSDDAKKKKEEEELKKTKEAEEEEKKKVQDLSEKKADDEAKGASGIDNGNNRIPPGTHRDRIMALFARYEPEKLVLLDTFLVFPALAI